VAASATALAPPQIAPQPTEKTPPTLTPIIETHEGLSAAGHTFIRDLGRSFFVNPEAAPDAGLVLGCMASDGLPTALEEATLGQLCCDRCECVALMTDTSRRANESFQRVALIIACPARGESFLTYFTMHADAVGDPDLHIRASLHQPSHSTQHFPTRRGTFAIVGRG
jgi:hypothetical protein